MTDNSAEKEIRRKLIHIRHLYPNAIHTREELGLPDTPCPCGCLDQL